MPDVTAATPLGIPGYSFADLHEPDRLASLYDRFCEEVRAADPSLWREWDDYRQHPDGPRPPIAVSNLLTSMAPYVSRFLGRLFPVGDEAGKLAEATHVQDTLFRFKVDFVRRRALPLLKGGANVPRLASDDALVEQWMGEPGRAVDTTDLELAVARLGCALMDREKAQVSAEVSEAVEALKRWSAARVHDPAFHHWVVFRFPETVDPWNLVEVERRRTDLPEAMVGQ